jgi:flagellar biosynthesis GTPase FlhF
MKIQRFEGDSTREALAKVQQSLGEDAVILQTRSIPGQGVLRRSRVEVLAAIDAATPPLTGPSRAETPIFPLGASFASSSNGDWRDELAGVKRELSLLRTELRLGKSVENAVPVAERLRGELKTSPIQLRQGGATMVALVGPSGVGKTTTLAKLAAAAIGEGRRVALITFDTYRIGALAQIEAYARLMEVPLSTIRTPDEVRGACERYLSYDLVLIDTMGCSGADAERLDDQASFLERVGADEVHLCLSASDSPASLRSSVAAFAKMKPTQILLTRLDETASLDAALASALDARKPLSYVTDGQGVPDDLALASLDDLTRRLQEGETR